MSSTLAIDLPSAGHDCPIVAPRASAIQRELSTWWTNARAVQRAMPRWLFGYLCAAYLVLALLVWWAPACEFDSMTSYLARIALERIGPLRQTATLEIQYLFPKFFDYLHAPLLEWGWFTTLPNFALFTITLAVVVWRLPPAITLRIILGLAACSPAIVNVTSAKNDITIALLSLLFWLWIYHANPESPWYAAVGLLIAALMVGTKWHGLVLGAMFMALMGVEMFKARSFRAASIGLAVCALPLAWYLSSADVYLENWRIDGSICPTPSYLQQSFNVPRNVAAFTANSLAETFEVPFYAADVWLQGKLWPWLNRMTFGAKAWNYAIMPTTHVTVYGITILVVIAGAIAAACARRTPWPVRAAALVAIGYCAVLLCCFHYTTYINRYFLVTYLLGLVPCAYLAQLVAWPRWVRWTFYSYLVFVSLQSVLLNQEKRLVPFKLYAAASNSYYETKALYADLFDREALQFHLWTGHLAPYRVLRKNLQKQDRLLIVNCHEGNSCPFIYPFLKERTATNTRIANLRFGQSVPHDAARQFEYVLVFRGKQSDPGFVPLYEDPEVAVYQNARLAAGKGG